MGIPQFNSQIDANGIPIVPKESDLWKKEKSFYRNWIIFSVLLIFVFIIIITAFVIMSFIWQSITIADVTNKVNADKFTSPNLFITSFQHYYVGFYLVFPIIFLVVLSGFLGLYIFSIVKSYKNKSFRFLITHYNLIIIFFTIFGIIFIPTSSLLRYAGGQSYIFLIILCVIGIAIYIYPLRKINKFKNEFNLSFMVKKAKEELLKNPNAFNQNGSNNPFGGGMFGNMFGGGMFGNNPYVNQPNNNPNNNPNPQNASNAEFKEAPAEEPNVKSNPITDQFDDMSTDQLKEIASKLLISGSELMTRPELLKRVRDLMDQQKQDEFGQKK